MNRPHSKPPSYSARMALTVYGLYSETGKVLATIRAADAQEARGKFKDAGLQGVRVKRVGT